MVAQITDVDSRFMRAQMGKTDLRLRPKIRASYGCAICKNASGSTRIYCLYLKEHVDNIVYCPHLEPKQRAIEMQVQS